MCNKRIDAASGLSMDAEVASSEADSKWPELASVSTLMRLLS
ncbi:MAG: hypothetical protein AAFU85_20730 [Planctomycetota bacterium]